MISPDFTDVFNPYYDLFSINQADFTVHTWFDQYVPDNQTDYQCLNVICPSITAGAASWTLNGKWITIGIYRDEGRAPAQRPLQGGALSWTRVGLTVTITDPSGHHLHAGDSINVFNINVPIMSNVTITVIDDCTFSFRGQVVGATSGTGASYQDNFITNFYDNFIVFRLLPSFALIPYSAIEAIFAATKPAPQPVLKTMYNITTETTVNVPIGTSNSVNYVVPAPAVTLSSDVSGLAVRFGQVFDSTGQPLVLTYLSNGFPTYTNNVNSPTSNEQIFYNSPVIPPSDSYIYVYDYYGLEINDVARGPTHSTSNVTRNGSIAGDINNLLVSPSISYVSTLNDLFGNLAIGVQSDNALVVRKQVLPIALNSFNQPVKNPS